MVLGNIDPAVIIDQSVLYFHSSIVIKGSGDIFVPLVMVEHGMLDFRLYFLHGGHDHHPEVLGFKNYDFIVIIFALFVVCPLTKKVSFLVRCSWFVVKREVVFS